MLRHAQRLEMDQLVLQCYYNEWYVMVLCNPNWLCISSKRLFRLFLFFHLHVLVMNANIKHW